MCNFKAVNSRLMSLLWIELRHYRDVGFEKKAFIQWIGFF